VYASGVTWLIGRTAMTRTFIAVVAFLAGAITATANEQVGAAAQWVVNTPGRIVVWLFLGGAT